MKGEFLKRLALLGGIGLGYYLYRRLHPELYNNDLVEPEPYFTDDAGNKFTYDADGNKVYISVGA